MMPEPRIEYTHSAEKARDTTVNDEKYWEHNRGL